jgi:GNAT superfamily N-acetyltransferase
MDLVLCHSCIDINWNEVTNILRNAGMRYFEADIHQKAFENSYAVLFVFDSSTMIGFGRIISDGTYQAALYDVAVLPEYQGKKIGSTIVKTLLRTVPGCSVILYASPGKEDFYKHLNFRKLKTGMALFQNNEIMTAKGFIE